MLRRKVVGNQRIGGGNTTGFANADTEAGEKQLPEILREAADRGHCAPERQRDRHDPRAATTIREHRNWNAECCVEKGECETAHHAQLRIT